MTGPPVKVDIVAGQNTAIPELQRTGTEIAKVARGAEGGLTPLQKLSKALVISEGREGSAVLRAVRGEVTNLAATAVGASGPVGRLLGDLGMLGVGGATGIAVVGGVAAIGIEIKKLVSYADDLDSSLKRLNLSVASGPAAALFKINDELASAAEIPVKRNFLGRNRSFLAGLSPDIEAAETIGLETEQTTRRFGANLQLVQFHNQHAAALEGAAEKERSYTRAVLESQSAVAKLELGLHPTHEQLAGLESTSRASAIALSNLSGPHKERLLLLEGERGRLERLNAAILDRQEADDRRRKDEQSARAATDIEPGDVYARTRFAALGLTETGTLPMLRGTTTTSAIGAGAYADTGPGTRSHYEVAGPDEKRMDSRALSEGIARGFSAALALAGGIRRGGAADILAGAGGAVSSVSQIGDLAQRVPGLGTIASFLSGVGGLVNLFKGGDAKVTARIDEESIAKLRDVLQLPQNVSPVIVQAPGTSMATTKYELDRLAAKTGVVTIPGRP
jgi:hypothetical protein